ncbi:isocitrate lyase/phosphoenolpyruvate mutase family protein [Saccharomonospora sp. NPDC046836]|uniref:isocitrate lyase/phosphoenolpyruvate mutase family protein n=1 Tax=Saccharomonospora sp. NPDC046836 TaxID=3156921 RepID=UPI0033ED3209
MPALFVNARVDTYWLGIDDGSPAATLARAERYRSAGADGIFVPGRLPDVPALVGIGLPLNVLALPGGLTARELGELGVRRISTGSLLFRAALHAAAGTAIAIRDGDPVAADLPTYADIQRLTAGS